MATTATFVFPGSARQGQTPHFYKCMAKLKGGMSPRFVLWTPAVEHILNDLYYSINNWDLLMYVDDHQLCT